MVLFEPKVDEGVHVLVRQGGEVGHGGVGVGVFVLALSDGARYRSGRGGKRRIVW